MFKSARRKIRIYRYNNPYSNRLLLLALETTITFVEIALVIAVGLVGYKLFFNLTGEDQKLSTRHTAEHHFYASRNTTGERSLDLRAVTEADGKFTATGW